VPDQPIGPILDGLGVTIDLAEGDLVSDAVVVAKVVDSDGNVAVALSSNESLSWLDELGLISAASDVVRDQRYRRCDTDDE
jgi:hypothetical protein